MNHLFSGTNKLSADIIFQKIVLQYEAAHEVKCKYEYTEYILQGFNRGVRNIHLFMFFEPVYIHSSNQQASIVAAIEKKYVIFVQVC